jgi:hypothetical protein
MSFPFPYFRTRPIALSSAPLASLSFLRQFVAIYDRFNAQKRLGKVKLTKWLKCSQKCSYFRPNKRTNIKMLFLKIPWIVFRQSKHNSNQIMRECIKIFCIFFNWRRSKSYSKDLVSRCEVWPKRGAVKRTPILR